MFVFIGSTELEAVYALTLLSVFILSLTRSIILIELRTPNAIRLKQAAYDFIFFASLVLVYLRMEQGQTSADIVIIYLVIFLFIHALLCLLMLSRALVEVRVTNKEVDSE